MLTAPPVAPDAPGSISVRELHELLIQMNASAQISRRRFIDALRALDEQQLYLSLGYPNIAAYAEENFRYGKTQTYEFVRVSRALENLPRLAALFESGKLSFSLLARLTHVADSETEGEWIEYLEGRPVKEVLVEVKDAIGKSRNRPRKDGFGLPGNPVTLQFKLPPEQHAIVEQAFAKLTEELSASLDGQVPSPEEVLVTLMDRVLHEGPESSGGSGRGCASRIPVKRRI